MIINLEKLIDLTNQFNEEIGRLYKEGVIVDVMVTSHRRSEEPYLEVKTTVTIAKPEPKARATTLGDAPFTISQFEIEKPLFDGSIDPGIEVS